MEDDALGGGIAALVTVVLIGVAPLGIMGFLIVSGVKEVNDRYGLMAASLSAAVMLALVGMSTYATAVLSPKLAIVPTVSKILAGLWVSACAYMWLFGLLKELAGDPSGSDRRLLGVLIWGGLLLSLFALVFTSITFYSFITRWFWLWVSVILLIIWLPAATKKLFTSSDKSSSRGERRNGAA